MPTPDHGLTVEEIPRRSIPAPIEATPSPEAREQDVIRRFAEDTAEHVMTVLKDDGLYRHIKFAKPGTGVQRFDLTTWPGHLAVSGDMGSLMFIRLPDMFEFFHTKPGRRIDHRYWAEKLTVGRDEVMKYDPGSFRRHVEDYTHDWVTDLEDEIKGWTDEDGVVDPCVNLEAVDDPKDAIRYELLIHADDEHTARAALDSFKHTVKLTNRDRDRGTTYEFQDTWEWDLREYTWPFMWLCEAIRWGVGLYFQEGGEVAYTERQWMDDINGPAPAAAAAVTR